MGGGSKVVELPSREFTDKVLPVPRELVSALFPESKMAAIAEAFEEMSENYVKRARYNEPCHSVEDQLALEFTQIVNEHVLEYVAGKDVARPEDSSASSSESVAGPTRSTPSGARAEPNTHGGFGRGRQHSGSVNTVPGYVMNVFPYQWQTNVRGEVQRLDDEPPVEDEDVEDPDEVRTRSGAALFRRDVLPELEAEADQPNWAYQSAFVQFAQEGAHNDPFHFGALDDSEIMQMMDEYDDYYDNDSRKRVLRQIRSYADDVSLYQHRTAVSSFVVMGRAFRAMHWDPSGVFVSEKVDYVRDTRALVEVLLAFIVADDKGQGYDPTVTFIPKDSEDYELMDRVADENYWHLPVLPCAEGTPLPPTIPVQTYVTFAQGDSSPADSDGPEFLVDDTGYFSPPGSPNDGTPAETTPKATTRRVLKDDAFIFQYVLDSFRESLTSGFLRYKLTIGGDEFLVAAPLFHDDRYGGARGHVAFHKQSGKLVFLKDSWRPHDPSVVTTEGDVLHKLNQDEVRNVPTLLCHGAVEGQVTRVLDHWMDLEDRRAESASGSEPRGVKRKRDDLKKEATPRVRHYIHYRIALKEVCLPLSAFTSSRQMVCIVGDAIDAHYDAMEKSRIIHRDVSSEAIAILPTFVEPEGGDDRTLRVVWRGILTEWEFARPIPVHGDDQPTVQPRTPDPWAARYISVSSFSAPAWSDPRHGTGIADELESFFNVLLHLAVRFCPHNAYTLAFICNNFVNSADDYRDAIYCPPSRRSMVAGSGHLSHMSSTLVFGRPEQPNKPLNYLLHMMLVSLHAPYKILKYEHEMAHPPDPSALRQRVDLGTLPDARKLAEWGESLERGAKARRPSDAIYRLADSLKDHSDTLDLFEEMKNSVWPEDDVVEDRLSFRAMLREAQVLWTQGLLRGYRSPSDSIPRDVVVAARRALSQRRILG